MNKVFAEFLIEEVEPFIDYSILLHNMRVKDTPHEKEVMKNVYEILENMKKENIHIKCAFSFFPCKKEKDTIIINSEGKSYNIPFIRKNYNNISVSLSDFFNEDDYIGAFVISINSSIYQKNEYLNIIESILLTRIAEAGAEYLHRYINKHYWNVDIRPAVGYPSVPDHSLKKVIFDLTNGEKTGAQLTSSFAMTPLSSVCGFYISNPKSFYF